MKTKIISILLSILLILSVNSIVLSEGILPEGKLIQPGKSIGEFTIGNYTMSDIKSIFGEPDTKRTEGVPQPMYIITGYSDQARAFGFNINSYILEILVTSNPVDYTPEGFHVGCNIEEVKKVYPISQVEGGHEWIVINECTIEKVKGRVDDYKLEQLRNIPAIGEDYHEEAWDTILKRLQFTDAEIEIIKNNADKSEKITYMSDGIKFVTHSDGTIVTILVSKIFK